MKPEQVRALCRMLVSSGDMTPAGARMFARALEDAIIEAPEYLLDPS